MGAGVWARDSNGHCLAWLAHRIPRPGDGELAEDWAAREAIQLALHQGWRHVILEGDCVNLICKLAGRKGDLSPIGPLIFDILCFACNFLSCHFNWVRRSGNAVARFLAQTATGVEEGDSVIPYSVLGLLSLDNRE
ncbi:UNVERIFIED_CONTAM: hypothetical protein Slati_1369300 [Sesamum latifolium]|uniref:RNase H type-1 domain-containing protein n=1 Tax=Sesamum latifolium TaxID=2727402 RepID=A0AAW2XIB4_9LAMI